MDLLGTGGTWYRGCTHTHTTNSDGELTPQEVVTAYKAAGFDFLFITDHDRITDPAPLQGQGILLIPGAEYWWPFPDEKVDYHLVALGPQRDPAILPNKAASIQEAIDVIRATGAMVVLAHPYWCGLVHHQMIGIERIIGLEVYNHVCEVEVMRGYSRPHWDELLAAGKQLYGLAADDAHWRGDRDSVGSWITVRADDLTPAAILDAIGRGLFYASSGPVIHDLRMEDHHLIVNCSPARAVNFMGRHSSGCTYHNDNGPITEIRHPMRGNERYLRVEVVGEDGTIAWSNPVYIEGIAK